MKRFILIISVLFIFSGCTPVLKQPQLSKEEIEAEREKQLEIAINTYIERRIRLYRVGLPLLKGS
ncbi:MAG: hypothetical protein NC917_05370, partial [Candidatus Omnitrophica bacterium]|nr:hypothetical protein [Candidatus Omnitrophota bacterium]